MRTFPTEAGLGVYFRDINERRKYEELLKQQAEALARSNSDLEHFAYAMAHNLREPVRMVTLFSELLRKKLDGSLDSETQEYLEETLRGSVRMDRLIRDLLDHTRAGSGEPAPIDIGADSTRVLGDVIRMLSEGRDNEVLKVKAEELPKIRVHEVHLQQIFQNLLSNAVKYRRTTPVHVTMRATELETGWCFAVSDNGIETESRFADF